MEQNIQSIYTFIREYRVGLSNPLIYTHIISFFISKENDIGLIAPFLELPSAEEYPDYYETIEQPIDMSMIKDKIDKGIVNKIENHIFISINMHHVLV